MSRTSSGGSNSRTLRCIRISVDYIVDSVKGAVAVMNTRTLAIERKGRVALSGLGGVRTSAQVSADGQTLYVGSLGDGAAVFAIDTTSLDMVNRWPMRGDVAGLGLSVDGLRLYVALEDRVAVLDATTGQELSSAQPWFVALTHPVSDP